jgi:hypothetical protein
MTHPEPLGYSRKLSKAVIICECCSLRRNTNIWQSRVLAGLVGTHTGKIKSGHALPWSCTLRGQARINLIANYVSDGRAVKMRRANAAAPFAPMTKCALSTPVPPG